MAPRQDVEHILQGGARGDVTMPMRRGKIGNAFFRDSLNRPSAKPRLELLECNLQRARAQRLQKLRGKLQLAANVVDGYAAPGDDLHAVVRAEA